MVRRYRPGTPNIPAQRQPFRVPYEPTAQADVAQFPPLQKPHEPGYGGPPPVYVVSTYDARPVNATDFNTQSGTNADDTGFSGEPAAGSPYNTSSIFYDVQPGYVAVLRNWHILIVPQQGEVSGSEGGNPIFLAANGASNFRIVIDVFVDGNPVQGMSGIVSWGGAFGDIFGECYVLANEGQRIEFRITATAGGSQWYQVLISMFGNLLRQKSYQLPFVPATDAILPVHEQQVQPLNAPANVG